MLLEANLNLNERQVYDFSPLYLDDIINTIGKKRSLLVLLQLRLHGKLRNKELLEKFRGVSPSTLSILLKQLQEERLIARKVFGEIPPLGVEYSLTKLGKEFLIVLQPLLRWTIEKNLK